MTEGEVRRLRDVQHHFGEIAKCTQCVDGGEWLIDRLIEEGGMRKKAEWGTTHEIWVSAGERFCRTCGKKAKMEPRHKWDDVKWIEDQRKEWLG